MNAKLLIITPTLGNSPFLDESAASVRTLELNAQRLFVCPQRRVEMLKERFPECVVTADDGPAGGLYGAINAGLRAAAALGLEWDWFTYINDDDLLAPGFSAMVERHCARGDLNSVAYGDITNIDTGGKPLGRMTIERDARYFAPLLQQGISPTGQQGMLFGATVVKALREYDLSYKLCGDLDFWVRAHARGSLFCYYPIEVGRFRIQTGQLSGDVMLTRRELKVIVDRHFPAPAGRFSKRYSKMRYRIYNLPRYLERWRSLGRLTTSESLLQSGPGPISDRGLRTPAKQSDHS